QKMVATVQLGLPVDGSAGTGATIPAMGRDSVPGAGPTDPPAEPKPHTRPSADASQYPAPSGARSIPTMVGGGETAGNTPERSPWKAAEPKLMTLPVLVASQHPSP